MLVRGINVNMRREYSARFFHFMTLDSWKKKRENKRRVLREVEVILIQKLSGGGAAKVKT